MSGAVSAWWTLLCVAALLNIAAWGLAARRSTRRAMLWLSAVYVLGCAFRSVLPMIDVPRACLHDPWIARIVVGRTIATLAELAFALQWALLLHEAGAVRAARAVVLLIAAAEAFSWWAVLTRNNLFHAAENSLWAICAGLALVFLATRWRLVAANGRRVIVAAYACGLGYIAFMVTVDVPMYLARWRAGEAGISAAIGFAEILERCEVVHDWQAWRDDALWLTLYFTVAVWISIAMTLAPPLKAAK